MNAGENVLLDCFIPTAYDVDIQWMKNDTPLNETECVMNIKSAKLTLRNINYSDYGMYQCYVNTTYYTRSVILTGQPIVHHVSTSVLEFVVMNIVLCTLCDIHIYANLKPHV